MEQYRPAFKAEHASFEDGQPVAVTMPEIDEDAPLTNARPWDHAAAKPIESLQPATGDGSGELADIVRRAMQETAIRVFQDLFAGDPSRDELYRRVILKNHILRPELTHAELALKLGVSRSRATQLLTKFKAKSLMN
jgi:Trp operon repressor